MRIFLKKFYRDLREAKGQFISVLAVVIIGVMFYTGLNSALKGLSEGGERYFREYRLADIQSSVYRAPEGVVKSIESIPGVKMAEGRVVQDAKIIVRDRDATVRLISLPDEKRNVVNDIQLKSGSYFSEEAGNQCIVSEDFFKANDLALGQIIEPVVNGDPVKLKVTGTAKGPEYTYEIREAGELLPDPEKFGVVYVKESYLQTVTDFKGAVNDISVLLNHEDDVKKVKEEMKKVLNQYGQIAAVEKKDQLSYSSFTSDVKSLESLGKAFPMFFFTASAVIIYITMTRMIENQRMLMGVLKALGYGNRSIMLHYQTYPLLVGILGSIIGSLTGVFFVGKTLLSVFNTYYKIPVESSAVHLELVLPASLLALFFCAAAGYNACRKELRPVPAESMRPKPPASGKRIFLENIPLFWNNINFSWKIIVRNIFRYKRRSAMASTGIIFSMVLLIIAMGMQDSIDYVMDVQFHRIQKFDIKVNFSKIMNADELGYIRGIDHVAAVEPLFESGMEITSGWRKKDISLIAVDEKSRLYSVFDAEGRPAEIPAGGIFLPLRLMDTLGVKSGDKVYLRSFYPGKNEEIDKKQSVVYGDTLQMIGQSAVCSIGYLDYLLKEGVIINAAYIKLDDPKYEKEVMRNLNDIMSVSNVQSKSEVVANTEKVLGSVISMVIFMILAAGVLAFAVIYNITNINIFERRREIATLSVLGFNSGELKSLIFNENFFLSTFGALAGILPGKLFTGLVISMQSNDNMQLPVIINTSSYFTATLLIVFFALAANFMLAKKIQDINMVESLKSAE